MHSPLPLYSPEQLRMLETRGIEACDGDAFALMARAGQAAWCCVLKHWPHAQRIVVACGSGNNGGDTLVARQSHVLLQPIQCDFHDALPARIVSKTGRHSRKRAGYR